MIVSGLGAICPYPLTIMKLVRGWAEFGAGGARGRRLGRVGGAGYAGLEAAEDHAPGSLHEDGLGGRVDQLVHLDVRAAGPRLGPEVSGPTLSLVMAMTGRKQADDELAGDGVATLRSRS
jgi:hypothetical protein